MLKLRHLEVFRAIMKTGSLTEAGQSLQMSQPAVSKALHHMEDLLGFSLFWRTKGRVQPTAEGLSLFNEVDKIFHSVSVMERYARDLRDSQSGVLSLACTPSLSYTFVAEAIARFRQNRPKVRVWVQIATTRQVLELASRRQIDLGLIYSPADDQGFNIIPLFETELVCVMRSDHPLASKRTVAPDDLRHWQLITNVRNEPIHNLLRGAFGTLDVDRLTMIGTNNTVTACSLVLANSGIALVEPLSVGELFPSLVQRPFRPSISVRPRVIHSKQVPLSRVAQLFVKTLQKTTLELVNAPAVDTTQPRRENQRPERGTMQAGTRRNGRKSTTMRS